MAKLLRVCNTCQKLFEETDETYQVDVGLWKYFCCERCLKVFERTGGRQPCT